MSWCVYQVEHVPTGIMYVGRTKDFAVAARRCKSMLRNGTHHNPELQAAWDFYRPEDFAFRVLAAGLDERTAVELVELCEAELRSVDRSYNLGVGEWSWTNGRRRGFRGRNHSEATRRRISAIRRAQGMKPANTRPVVVAGVAYASLSEAAARTGVPKSEMHRRLRAAKWADYQYAS